MCLSIAVHRPDNVLAKGEHMGYEWQVIHNGNGYRCGYVRVPAGHPWHGMSEDEIDCKVHGGLTFSANDLPCAQADKPEDGYWLGFDCCHCWDLPDPALPATRVVSFYDRDPRSAIRTQEYVEAECRSLCEQAAKASVGEGVAP
jgi:hypothetical protein